MEQPLLAFGDVWVNRKDGDDTVRAIFDRHYSRRHYRDGRKPKIFVGPGEKLVLMMPDAKAIFIWRKFISDDGQQGICCAVFRNEGTRRSSELIKMADEMAWTRWPGQRLYTYVNPKKINSCNPGFCFKAAGWRTVYYTDSQSGKRRVHTSKDGKHLLEMFPDWVK